MIISNTIKLKPTVRNVKYYINKGYNINKKIDKNGRFVYDLNTEILVKIEDLNMNSRELVECCCDKCNNHYYEEYISARKNKINLCDGCKENKKNISFEDWCINNERGDLLELWDYDLNNKKPNEISCFTNKKYYFKCPKGIHKSEIYTISNLLKRKAKLCRTCNSFGQWLINTYGDDAIEKYWSKNNTVNPFEISYGSGKKVLMICQHCKHEKLIACNSYIQHRIMCNRCSDNVSYSNKFMYELLSQLKIDFEIEKEFTWSVISNNDNKRLNGKKIYDIYIPSSNMIIENHGEQHYFNTFKCSKRTLEEEQENDRLKEELALINGIEHYIQLNCMKSEYKWIKKSIFNSELHKLLNFKEEDIDWNKCLEFANSNLILYICNLWNNRKEDEFVSDIPKNYNIKISTTTIIKYLKIGNKLGWCNYNSKEEKERNIIKKSIRVGIFKEGMLYKIIKSKNELEKISIDIFGEKISHTKINRIIDTNSCINGYYIKTI